MGKTLMATNKSGYEGVAWYKRKQRWEAYITVNGKKVHLGKYKDIHDAVKARKDAEFKYAFREPLDPERYEQVTDLVNVLNRTLIVRSYRLVNCFKYGLLCIKVKELLKK